MHDSLLKGGNISFSELKTNRRKKFKFLTQTCLECSYHSYNLIQLPCQAKALHIETKYFLNKLEWCTTIAHL